MLTNFMLLSGNDIPFPEARIMIHQPRLKEIALIGEQKFFLGCGLLNFSKELLDKSDKVDLSNIDDFDILMKIMISGINEIDKESKEAVNASFLVLTLLFPNYEINFLMDKGIELKRDNMCSYINSANFVIFKKLLSKIFGLSRFEGDKEFNPSGNFSKKIVEKLKKRHQQLAEIKGSKKQDVFGRYISILAVGLGKSFETLFQYTIYQLYDEIQRFNLKRAYDAYFKAKLAGAQDLEDVQDWEIDLEEVDKINKNK